MGPYQKQLSTRLKKTSHTNYMLTKVTGWNFLKKNSSVSYREASRLKPFWHPSGKPDFLYSFHGKVVKNSVAIKSKWFWIASPTVGVWGEGTVRPSKGDSKRVMYMEKLDRFWRFKNKHHILGVHMPRTLLCGFFEVLGPWTEFLNSPWPLWRDTKPLPWIFMLGQKQQKINLLLNIHTVFELERVSFTWEDMSMTVCLCHCPGSCKGCSHSAIVTRLYKVTWASRGRRWQLPMVLEVLEVEAGSKSVCPYSKARFSWYEHVAGSYLAGK